MRGSITEDAFRFSMYYQSMAGASHKELSITPWQHPDVGGGYGTVSRCSATAKPLRLDHDGPSHDLRRLTSSAGRR